MNSPVAALTLGEPPRAGEGAGDAGRAAGGRSEATLLIGGMYCAACSGTIETALLGVAGVSQARVSAAGERAQVGWDPARAQLGDLIAAVRRAGYDAAPEASAPAQALRRAETRTALWRLFVAWFCMMQVMMLAWPSYIAAPGEMPDDLRKLLNWGQWVLSIPVMVWSAAPYFEAAWRSLRTRRMAFEFPVALALAVTFVASTGATFHPQGVFGHEVYFDSLTMFVAFLLAARWLQMRARHRAECSYEAALAAMPRQAWRLDDAGTVERVEVEALRPGDTVRVPLGEAFPADGRLLDGPALVDEALLTGESTPVARAAGEAVVAASVNAGAVVHLRVERVGEDTRYHAIVALMRQALTERPALARIADRWATPFLWIVLLSAAVAAGVWSTIDPQRAVWIAVAVLVVTCPCALALSAPTAMTAAAGALARRGVLIARMDVLEPLAGIARIFIDKTGTLTEERMELAGVHALPAVAEGAAEGTPAGVPALQQQAAALAAHSSHPLSRALVAATPRGGDGPAAPWREVVEVPGQGVQGVDGQGRVWRLGRAAWVEPEGPPAGGADAGGLRLVFGCAGRALLGFTFDERLREDAAQTLRELAAQGVAVELLSGDVADRVERLAARLRAQGVAVGVRAAASPEAKLATVREAQARGERVAMVGDGVNDAPVLAQADVGIAMGQGALVARSSADAIVVGNRLASIAHARRHAGWTLAIVRQNIALSWVYNAMAIPAAALGWVPPWAAGLGMALSSVVVVANSMRLARD
jgi:Cu2+-exporting ATPase